jgi:hypothetical protein
MADVLEKDSLKNTAMVKVWTLGMVAISFATTARDSIMNTAMHNT